MAAAQTWTADNGNGTYTNPLFYANLRTSAGTLADSITVSVDVTNTGTRAGDEVVQLYLKLLSSAVERPLKHLRGFERITLAPGQQRTVTFKLSPRDVAYWNAEADGWAVEPGRVQLQVGASSSDIRFMTDVSVRP